MSDVTLLEGRAEGDRLLLAASGSWTAPHALELETLIEAQAQTPSEFRRVDIDMGRIERLDTFGAWLLERLVRAWKGRGAETTVTRLAPNYQPLIDEVRNVDLESKTPEEEAVVEIALGSVGWTVSSVAYTVKANLNMLGAVVASFLRVIRHPRDFRITSMVHNLDHVAWRAVPIILLITFLIGCIIAQQGIFHFRKFGAETYVVDMVGILILREIGVLIVAIMVAGRSGSAFTAELGSMKMREEIDALRTMGFDPVEVLVLPRVMALFIALPILTFIGSMSALYGGIDPDVFLQRLKEAITLDHFKVGMIKAPFMALVIGIVSCVCGFEVKGSAESLGSQTTESVVESIFLVIVLDGLFAIFFASIGM
ncbi:MAG: MlaE family lipid ABC transporter permease subunit [Pseudolabrys sp.]|nr:MlaE family lipid ABC transporter permease subunit [Pseudolabrys sp.]